MLSPALRARSLTSGAEPISRLIGQLQETNRSNHQDGAKKNKLLSLSRELTQALQPPSARAFEIIYSFPLIPCVHVAADLGILGLLKSSQPQTAYEIAKSTGADPLLLWRIFRVLSAHGVLKEIAEPEIQFASTPVSDILAVPGLENGIKHAFEVGYRTSAWFPTYARETKYQRVEEINNGPFQYANQTKLSLFDWLKEHPREATHFNITMAGFAAHRTPWTSIFPVEDSICKGFHDQDKALIVDVAGGIGHDLMIFQNHLPNAKRMLKNLPAFSLMGFVPGDSLLPSRLILQDQQDVIDAIPKGSINPTIEVMSHDIFQPQPIKGARCYFLKHVLYDWYDSKALDILRHVKVSMENVSMENHSKIIIVDKILSEDGPLPPAIAGVNFLMMMVHTSGEQTKTQWEGLLGKAGLKITGLWVLEGEGVLEAMLA